MSPFAIASTCALVSVVLVARFVRGPLFAAFAGILLSIYTLVAVRLAPLSVPLSVWCFPLFVYLHAAVYVHFLMLARARMRPLWYRILISVPASFFSAGTLLGIPWAIASAFSDHLFAPWLPYLISLVGVLQSLRGRHGEVDIVLTGEHIERLERHRGDGPKVERPLRIVQITDPHLGPFMSEDRLRRICQRAVDKKPDLVFLTGDFLTMESHGNPALLGRALSPLAALEGRVFACPGNHDHEDPESVARGLAQAKIRFLVDDAEVVETDAGRVQVVGMDFAFSKRSEKMQAVCTRFPRENGSLRVILLHDPGAFKHLPPGEGDLVLSGHTHGGQLGLVSLGLAWTVVSAFSNIPDHGLWARGKDRLYVHRGTGHYGFPLRLGVPSEESVLRVHVAESRA